MLSFSKIFLLLFFLLSSLYAQDYKLGHGYEIYNDDALFISVGAHADINYHMQNEADSIALGQAGLMLSGEYNSIFRFLVEVGSDDTYIYNFNQENESTDFQLMRLYGEYLYSDALELKIGQFLTPIGIWNRAYIPALRWSGFTPFVAEGFFPKIIAGASLGGFVTEERLFSYSLFYHVDGEHDTNRNNVQAKEFFGGEFRYHFSLFSKIAIPFGRFRSDSSQEICYFTGLNTLIPFNQNEFSSEFLLKNGKWTNEDNISNTWQEIAWYIQYVQHIYKDSYLSVRYGEKQRFQSSTNINWNDSNAVLGYIYKPKETLNVKLEYRHRERTGLNELNSNEGLLSFSVLF